MLHQRPIKRCFTLLLVTLLTCVQLAGIMHVTKHLLGQENANDGITHVIATQQIPTTSSFVSVHSLNVDDLVCAVCRAQADFVAALPSTTPLLPSCAARFVQQAEYVAYSDCIFALQAKARSPPVSRV